MHTFKTTGKFYSHGNVTRPRLWIDSDETCDNNWFETVLYYPAIIRVSREYLVGKIKKNWNVILLNCCFTRFLNVLTHEERNCD